jgi:glycosyltransferase involved in cell wall biosynthesis
MRILLAIGTLEVGGAELQLARLATELHQRGHEVTVMTMSWGGPLADQLEEAGVPTHVGSWLISPRWFIPEGFDQMPPVKRRLIALPGMPARMAGLAWRRVRLRQAVRRLRPDVCHVWLPAACAGLLPVAASARVPVRVAGWRAIGESVDNAGQGRIARELVARSAHVFVANSEAVAADLYRRVPPPRRVEVIPNGVDLPDEQADPGREDPVGMLIANFNTWKGHAEVVAAMALLERPPRLRFIGDGRERANIEAAIEAAGVGDRIHLDGRLPDARRHYTDAQFAVLASHHEGLPNAVLEAMAAGLPTVATAVGGVPELIEDGVTGLLVPPRDPAALAEALARISADGPLRRRMGAAARERVADLGWPTCVERYLALYRELLDGPPGRGSVGARLVDSSTLSDRPGVVHDHS